VARLCVRDLADTCVVLLATYPGPVRRAVAVARDGKLDAGIADALCAVAANGLLGVPDMDLVRRSARAAYEHAKRAGDDFLMARGLAVLTPALPAEERLAALEEAATLLIRAGNQRELAVSYSNSAYSALVEGRYDEGLALAERAMSVAQGSDDPNIMAFTAANLGVAALLSKDFERARDAFGRQLRLCGQHAFRWQAAEGFAGLAAVAAHDGQFERSARLQGAAGAITQSGEHAILERIEHDFIGSARLRYGETRWRDAQTAGATMSFRAAIDYALGADRADQGPSAPRLEDALT
jgi:tetratricopeptide (TPR) repeat protein